MVTGRDVFHSCFFGFPKTWKITVFNGKINYKWPCSIAMLVYQRHQQNSATDLDLIPWGYAWDGHGMG